MAAVAALDDPFARHGLTILRGTGMRLGELLDPGAPIPLDIRRRPLMAACLTSLSFTRRAH